jgi:hypothetical protein
LHRRGLGRESSVAHPAEQTDLISFCREKHRAWVYTFTNPGLKKPVYSVLARHIFTP